MSQEENIGWLLRKNEENYLSYMRAYSNVESARFVDSENVVMSISAVDGISMLNNFVSKARVDESGVDEIIEEYKRAGRPMMWAVFPCAESSAFGGVLKKKGLIHYLSYALIHCDLFEIKDESPVIEGLEIGQVEDVGTFRQWFGLQSISFGYTSGVRKILIEEHCGLFLDKKTPAKHYLGYLDGKPVGTLTLFIADGVAGLYNATTVPEVRGKGVGTAMAHHGMMEGRKAGCRFATAQATKQGLPVWQKMGWETTGQLDLYLKMHGRSVIKLPATLVQRTVQGAMRRLFNC